MFIFLTLILIPFVILFTLMTVGTVLITDAEAEGLVSLRK